MSELVSPCFTFSLARPSARVKWTIIGLVMTAMFAGGAQAQDGRKVPLSFLPPPLENATYSLGIYEGKSGKLVRRLQEIAPESAFTIGLNGLMTNWDGKDDDGKAVAPGRYAARGYAVGALKIQGEGVLGNEWAGDDGNLRIRRVEAIATLPDDRGLGILAEAVAGPARVACYGGVKASLQWQKPLPVDPSAKSPGGRGAHFLSASGDTLTVWDKTLTVGFEVSDGTQKAGDAHPAGITPDQSVGKEGTIWKIEEGELCQFSPDGEKLRRLKPASGEPVPVAVAASSSSDQIYLLEEMPGWQRVRGLSWVETKEENGKKVSTWQTFFERNIRPPDPEMGLDKPALPVRMSLVENPLSPGKPPEVKLIATFDDKGSYLTTADGLRLRRVGQFPNLKAAKVTSGTRANRLAFYQFDGAAWDEFSIEGAKNMMEFDAGEFEMTAIGEKTHAEKAVEPPDL